MRLLVAGLAGALTAWAFTPMHWWAAIIGLAVLLQQLSGQLLRQRLKISSVFSLALFLCHIQWVSVLGVDAWIALAILCALPWLLLALVPIDSSNGWFYLAPAAGVAVLEAVRSSVPWGGFPWGLIAYSQLDGPLVKLATLGGQGLVSGVVVLCAAALIKLVKHRCFTSLLIVAICVLAARSVDTLHSDQTVTLSAVQGNVPRVGNEVSTQRTAVLNNHIIATKRLLIDIESGKTATPDLIVWPESGTDIDPLQPGLAQTEITQLADSTDIPILIGATTLSGGDSSTAVGPRNAGILWTAESGPGQMYVKRHLVPFGEYVPLREFLSRFIKRFEQIPNDFVPGNAVGVFNIANKQIGDVICFEVAYANHIYETVATGAQVMVVQTNNATYGNTAQPEQQFAITRFRAIENQRAFLVASTSGISGLIANDGKVLHKTGQFETATVTGEVELISDQTFTNRYPRWMLIFSALVLLICYRRTRGQNS
ncbi:unannotated protein [freshwater metagenome]|uniref:Unannotated protein n=1 Tax=freshwater metagenome TaxID=449393 RepID=A0A6J7QCN6_9ZZZZ|nr:apolipoprotein N-acyltransferase [Actinomycetota bacterium]MSW24461.1 apolipoprotein N-acyltransferase [Actinomycetota bacterium]MSX30090.1 apolipoprotein N-acyltransferase [Actinomycetota bacterium]MSX97119.1 apolipoprotein N-acyltransferase [Actinomycetota bacterium]MSZ79860.1 apolipoprotein N-acyltransferase [Actinomycetota bacterium]